MSDRAPWFKCFPSLLLGALSAMSPDEGYTYTVLLMRLYEADGPVAETARTLSRRSGLSERRVAEAIEGLIAMGKVQRLADGRLDSDTTHAEIADRADRREAKSDAGKASAEKRAKARNKVAQKNDDEKTQQNQQNSATGAQQNANEKQIEIDIPSETTSLRDTPEGAIVPKAKQEREAISGALAEAVSDDRVQAIIEFRKRIKAPLTLKAAQLLAKRLLEASNPNAGADLMIERGWRGFDPSWMGRGQDQRMGPMGARDAPSPIGSLFGTDRMAPQAVPHKETLSQGLRRVMEMFPDDE